MRVLALDIGERRIGVAVSDPLGLFARPLCTVERASKADDFAAIGALVAEHAVERVVVGLPLTLRGEMGPQACQIDRYAEALAAALPVPVTLWDERYSTSEAADIIQQSHRKHRERGEIDAVAAAVILQGFLDSRTVLEENV
ncbi:MAG: Holliday junction resolvase RuvX [Anaerolineae bacterium]|nr:Holliday junction resolvase RuvX [Anaerolineae bacterium]